jgi:alpha-L-rhamnosidase
MKAFLGYLEKTSQDHIRCYPEYPHFKGFGDWLSINAETPHDLIGTAYFAYSAKLLSEIATALGESGDAQTYQKLFEEVREAFQRRFVTAEGLVHSGTQTALVLALHFDLLPEHLRSSAMVQLVRDIRGRGNHLSTGFVGSSYLPHVLSDGEQWDVVFDLLLQKSWPSWLYAVTQGATTIWERWDGWTHDKGFQDPGMNSFNHYAYGAIGSWMYQVLAGIDLHPEVPGYRKFVIRPHVGGGIEWVKAKHTCLFGDIRSEWSLESGEFVLTVEVPVGTEAEVVMPFSGSTHAVVSGVKTFREPIQS